MKYHYSVIIPHHNIPHLLRRCLSSIPIREDVQVIVVDDKSEDVYQADLHRLEKSFSWVSFIFLQESHGAGKARNVGLEYAKGDYVLFADADDFFNYCIIDIFDEYVNSKFDAIFFNANSLDTNTYTATFRCIHLNTMIKMHDRNPQKAVFELKYEFGEPWCKMVKRKIIDDNNISFSETIIHNDTKYSYLVGYYCRNIHIDKRAVYCVTDRIGSVSKRISVERLLTRTLVFAEANRFFKEHGIKRFDERALRPLISFIMKKDWSNAKKCIKIINASGMNTYSLAFHCLALPLSLISKCSIICKKAILRFI